MTVDHHMLVGFAKSFGLFFLIAMAIVALVYALWPANRGRFDRAAKSILDDGGDAPLNDDEDKPCR